MCGKYKQGFSFIELMLILFIMGLALSMAIPTLQYLFPGYRQREFIARLSALAQIGWQQALSTQRIHRILLDVEHRKIILEKETDTRDNLNQPIFQPTTITLIDTILNIPDTIEIRQFYLGAQELLARAGIKTEKVWFYIMPDGLTQEVIINFLNTQQVDAQGQARQYSLVLNPFNARFTLYEEFRKP